MKFIVLSDNRTINPNLGTEHGLSIYLETENHKFLLDTGASDLYIQNAIKLNVDISAVDFLFISHGHADHIGGLASFLEINSKAKIIVSTEVKNGTYYSKRTGLRKISIEFDFDKYADRFLFITDNTVIDKDIFVYKNKSEVFLKPLGNNNLYKNISNNELTADDFTHELIFVTGSDKLFVFTGCAHHGVLNILETVKKNHLQLIRWVVGGFHLLDKKDDQQYEATAELETISRYLNRNYPNTEFITGHCTGDVAYDTLKPALEYKLVMFFTGYTNIS